MNLSNANFELLPSQITSSLSITNMPPDFSWCNFIMNALHLASGASNDPNILGHFLNHLTGHSYVRVDSTDADGNVQRNEAQGRGYAADFSKDQFTSSKGHHISSSGISPPSERESPPPPKELKLDDDTDDQSFRSCSNSVIADGVQSALFGSADSARFPQGNTLYVVNDPTFRLSWTMMTYGFNSANSKGDRTIFQSCLGIYKCPTSGCMFVRSAVAPRNSRAKFAKPMKAFGSDICLVHGALLVHIPCTATCTISCNISSVTI